tara:strand:+ start:2406 stop:3362 length:957 start_codon:yes stop_codon:yes gene_type:complete
MLNILKTARQILHTEAHALSLMAEQINQDFVQAIEAILQCRGKIIVTGMGKSGHIARKIASTLISTGSLAVFLHPAEAQHGDMGIVQHQDIVIAISKSGESQELTGVLNYCNRNNIPIIAITAKKDSSLAQHSQHVLLLPDLPEACPLDLAPMTSTTMTLALGDAIAGVLMQEKKFNKEKFREYHPGGKLGSKLMTLSDIMHCGDKVPIVKLGTVVSDTVLEITKKRLGCVGIINDEQQLIGIFTDGDLRKITSLNPWNNKIDDFMTPNPFQIKAHDLVSRALQVMEKNHIPSIFITDANQCPIGIIHIHDILALKIL